MRQQLLRTLRRSQRPASQANAVRNLSSSARRAAEVELTIDGKKVSIEGTQALETI
jgi:NADH dehydrogenase (ubiquinone) Fe-S protein 1